jgi:7-cyano-7-deazaguanine synthase in queuosine biosynthesis
MSENFQAVVSFENQTPSGSLNPLLLKPDFNLRTGIADFSQYFPVPTSLEKDLLLLASTVYACDLAFKRGVREEITRSIEITIPVVNYHAFERLNDQLVQILWLLSHDNWTINFTQLKDGESPERQDWQQSVGKTLLFSGGLDSLAGAVALIDEFGVEAIQLASHITANPVTRSSQQNLIEYLKNHYQAEPEWVVIRTGGRKNKGFDFPSDDAREETQRTRSFMFLTIAALAARRRGKSEVVMIAENGQMAIHLPLTIARMGAFSTHTAHPEFIQEVGTYFTNLLGFPIEIFNPYLYKTKGETIAKLVKDHAKAVAISVSCWRGSRLSKEFNHCGECVPCLIRRISTEHNGLKIPEFARDLLSEDVNKLKTDDEGRRNLSELSEFAKTFDLFNDADIEFNYPDLISPFIEQTEAIAMYRRFAKETRSVFNKYEYAKNLFGPSKAVVEKNVAPEAASENSKAKKSNVKPAPVNKRQKKR